MDPWPEPILHVDMDAFFVEVERLRRPDLRGRPVAVGGTSSRSVVASASYEARAYGVSSAMPTAKAMRMCPELVMVPADHSEYGRISGLVFDVFRSFTPAVEGLSVDEAFLDVSGLRRHYPDPVAVAKSMRAEIRSQVGIPASVGIAASKFVAKLASAAAKPDGLRLVRTADQVEFIHSLPLGALWGVGPATMAALARFGIATVAELAATDPVVLVKAVGAGLSKHLLDLAHGRDPRAVETESAAKSISAEETFERDLTDTARMESVLRSQADRVAERVRRAGLSARTVTLKVRFADFQTVTRSETLPVATSNDLEIYRAGLRLLERALDGRPVRLLGLGCSGFDSEGGSPTLNLDARARRVELDQAVDAIRARFGTETIGPANRPDRQK